MTGTGRARGTYRGTPAKRAEIVQVALAEFAGGGYEAASLRSIAARVGISHPGLLHHFRTKDELLVAVLTKHEDDERAELAGYAPARTVAELAELLVAAVTSEQRTPDIVRLRAGLNATATRPDHPAHEFVVRRYARWIGELREQLDGIGAGGGAPAGLDTPAAATAVLAVVQGLLAHWLADPAVDVAGHVRDAVHRLCAATPPPPT